MPIIQVSKEIAKKLDEVVDALSKDKTPWGWRDTSHTADFAERTWQWSVIVDNKFLFNVFCENVPGYPIRLEQLDLWGTLTGKPKPPKLFADKFTGGKNSVVPKIKEIIT